MYWTNKLVCYLTGGSRVGRGTSLPLPQFFLTPSFPLFHSVFQNKFVNLGNYWHLSPRFFLFAPLPHWAPQGFALDLPLFYLLTGDGTLKDIFFFMEMGPHNKVWIEFVHLILETATWWGGSQILTPWESIWSYVAFVREEYLKLCSQAFVLSNHVSAFEWKALF